MMIKKIVYFDDLSKEAKEKARAWFRDGNDYPFLEEEMVDFIREELKKESCSVEGLSVKYSLGYSQGDGVSFLGTISKGKKTWTAEISTAMQYVHANMMDVMDENGDIDEKMTEKMRGIARKAEKYGYSSMEEDNKDEYVDETIRINEYTFSIEGERMNPDK